MYLLLDNERTYCLLQFHPWSRIVTGDTETADLGGDGGGGGEAAMELKVVDGELVAVPRQVEADTESVLILSSST